MNIEHLFDGTYDLVIVPAGAAYEAYTGTGACEGEKKEKLRAVAACYPIVSTWISPKKLGLSKVQELKGHPLAVGNEGSETAKVSGEGVRCPWNRHGEHGDLVLWDPGWSRRGPGPVG